MGNCIKKQSAIHPAADYLGDGEKKVKTEIQIKISKKQLEELLGMTDVQGLIVEQVLAWLMNVSDRFESHQLSWRPALQSISE